MCDKYNIRIGLEQGLNKLLFGNEEIPFDENFIKLCKDNNKDCEKIQRDKYCRRGSTRILH